MTIFCDLLKYDSFLDPEEGDIAKRLAPHTPLSIPCLFFAPFLILFSIHHTYNLSKFRSFNAIQFAEVSASPMPPSSNDRVCCFLILT